MIWTVALTVLVSCSGTPAAASPPRVTVRRTQSVKGELFRFFVGDRLAASAMRPAGGSNVIRGVKGRLPREAAVELDSAGRRIAEWVACDAGGEFRVMRARSYYPSGRLKSQATLRSCIADAPQKTYWEDGALKAVATYVDDVKSGPMVVYHPNGKVKIETTFRDGKENDRLTQYDEDGRKIFECDMESGEAHGRCVVSAGGRITAIIYYEHGRETRRDRF